jgi:hypothetical protein
MSKIVDNTDSNPVLNEISADPGMSARVFRTMAVAAGLAVSLSVFIAPWRFTTGLLLGGLLALINHHWLQGSISAAFAVIVNGETPQLTIGKYFLRYLVIGTIAFLAYKLRIAALPAILAGLSTFVVALFVEALREFYFAIIQREEIS